MKPSALNQFFVLCRQNVRGEFANFDRLLAPVLFALIGHVMFYFALGQVGREIKSQIFIAQTFIILFFALQIALARAFEPEAQDQAFQLLRVAVLRSEAWFLAKYLSVLLSCFMIVGASLALSYLLFQDVALTVIGRDFFVVIVAALIGLSALGLLLAGLMLRVEAKQILFPLLYFPLTTPVLIAGIQAANDLVEKQVSLLQLAQSWLGLLLVFDVIYITLSVLLFAELTQQE